MAGKADIDAAIALAEAETGCRGGQSNIPLCFKSEIPRARLWTDDEDQFIRDNHGRISESDLGRHLGRSRQAVHIRIERELKLPGMSKRDDLLTCEQIANGLGIDGKSIALLIDTGRMPGRRLPSSRVMRVVDRLALMQWILNPDHWCYFKPERVGMKARRGKRGSGEIYDFAFWENAGNLIVKARRRWKDRWLTPGQVTNILRIDAAGTRYVNKAIRKGTLKATRWGNWWIRESDLPKDGKTINYRGDFI